MQPADVIRACKVLLLKIHVITGWTIPGNELMIILVDQFSKKLTESYPALNADEIEYAFRQGGTVVEDWGKEMNLNLLDKVLIPYINQRLYVSAAEERKVEPPAQKIFTEVELEDGAREDVERQYQAFLRGQELKSTEFNRSILAKDKLLNENETTIEFFKRKAEAGFRNIYTRG